MSGAISEESYRRAFWCVLAVGTGLRLALAGRVGLSTDEAHYVLYARHLAWGYFDHPPLVAFLGALGLSLGDGTFFARLGPIVCWTLACVLLRRLALSLYSSEAPAFWSFAVILSLPLSHLLAVALLPDATLGVFWCGALLAAWRATRAGGWTSWLVTGAVVGGALLSKYHGVLLVLCLGGYLLSGAAERRWLLRPQPWIALALAALVFLPNVLWNQEHAWISYAYQLGRGVRDGSKPSLVLENAAGQLGAASPIPLALLVVAWLGLRKRRPLAAADRYALWTSLPVFAFFLLSGVSGKLLPHWTFVGWWTGSLLVARAALEGLAAGGARARRWRRWTLAGAALAWLMIAIVYVGLARPLVLPLYAASRAALGPLAQRAPFAALPESLEPHADPTNELFGWDELAREVERIRASMPRPARTFVFCHRFFSTSSLGVYLARDTVATSLHAEPGQYRLWFDPLAHAGWDAVFVDVDRFRRGPERYRDRFERMDPEPERLEVRRDRWTARRADVYRYYGFLPPHEASAARDRPTAAGGSR